MSEKKEEWWEMAERESLKRSEGNPSLPLDKRLTRRDWILVGVMVAVLFGIYFWCKFSLLPDWIARIGT